ncbi:MAG: FAD-binding protein [Neomegalonema sp.]|nr:FAD-binding protein [Neomegalonema sp.]
MTDTAFARSAERLSNLLGDRLATGESILALHARGASHHAGPAPEGVAFPETAEEVAEILKICVQTGCAVTPFGVGSSLEGHVVPLQRGLSLDMSRMDKILAIHPDDLDAVVQPGVTREQLNADLRDQGLMFAVDPGANATLGGMAATRASGTNAVRYGTMRETVLALQVALADGRLIRTGGRARKSSAGYDLTRLFVGSEGTLGVITEVTVRLYGRPMAVSAATVAFESVEGAAQATIAAIQYGLGVARIELLDQLQIRAANAYSDLGLPEKPHLFVEFHGTEAGVAEQAEMFGEIAADCGGGNFAWATREEDRNKLWKARHDGYWAAKALRPGAEGFVTDACVPISALAECIAATRADIDASGLIAPIVGHVGDGNFHLSILIDPNAPEELEKAKALASKINTRALEFGGTVTGEHGVGAGKRAYMQAEHGDAWAVMGDIKRTLDPNGILNPGKVVPDNR